jgi:hypothetical protein
MSECPTGPIHECFEKLGDPRVEHLCDHKLLDIVVLTICAVICGANHWTDVELYGHSKESWLRGFLELKNGIPSHDTIGSVFSRLDPDEFRTCFVEWVKTVTQPLPAKAGRLGLRLEVAGPGSSRCRSAEAG